MTTTFYLYPVLSLNNMDWINLQLLPVGGCGTVLRISYHTISLLGLPIDVCKYICIEILRFCVIVWYILLEINDLVMTILLLFNRLVLCFWSEITLSWHSYFLFFLKDSVRKWHSIFMYAINGIEETSSVEKTSIILFGIK